LREGSFTGDPEIQGVRKILAYRVICIVGKLLQDYKVPPQEAQTIIITTMRTSNCKAIFTQPTKKKSWPVKSGDLCISKGKFSALASHSMPTKLVTEENDGPPLYGRCGKTSREIGLHNENVEIIVLYYSGTKTPCRFSNLSLSNSKVVMSPQSKIGGWEVCPITFPPISKYSIFHLLSLLGNGITKEPYKQLTGRTLASVDCSSCSLQLFP
jgi:hypothetical protein